MINAEGMNSCLGKRSRRSDVEISEQGEDVVIAAAGDIPWHSASLLASPHLDDRVNSTWTDYYY